MDIKIKELLMVNQTLQDIMDKRPNDINTAYQLAKIKRQMEDIIAPIVDTLVGRDKEELDLLVEKSEHLEDVNKIALSDLENLDLSITEMYTLLPLIEE